MATMPAVANEPWKWAEQEAKLGDDLYKMFYDQRFRGDQAQQERALRQQLQGSQQDFLAGQSGLTREFQAGQQRERLDAQSARDELLYGGGAPAASGKLVDRMRDKMNDLIGMGIPQHVAAAMVGNAVQESKLSPTIVGDGGASIGEYQFNEKGELPALRAYAAKNGGDINDPKVQRAFVWSQLQGPYRATLDKMLAAKDPAVAAEIFSREYERPNAAYANNKARAKYATQAYTLYGVRNADASNPQTSAGTPPTVGAPIAAPGQQQPASTTPVPSGTGTMPQVAGPAGGRPRLERAIDPATGKLVFREVK